MESIPVTVLYKSASAALSTSVQGENNVSKLVFTLPEEWTGEIKRVVFKSVCGVTLAPYPLDINNSVLIPSAALDGEGMLQFQLFGANAQGTTLRETIPASLRVYGSLDPLGGVTPIVYLDVVASAQIATGDASLAAISANASSISASSAAAAANIAKTSADDSASSATTAANNANVKATLATDKASLADAAATNANTKAGIADIATTAANLAKTNTDIATTNAITATNNAMSATTAANTAAGLAETATAIKLTQAAYNLIVPNPSKIYFIVG